MKILPKEAFTMAEAILVMTILGIIATIMITTLKPADFKEKGMAILDKKILSEIDTATTMILINNSFDGTMIHLYEPNSSNVISFQGHCPQVAKLYKKYLTATRKTYFNASTKKWIGTEAGDGPGFDEYFYLKDGAWLGIKCSGGDFRTRFPGENTAVSTFMEQGRIIYDVNGDEEPNSPHKDIYMIPIGNHGIMYADELQ